MADRAPMKLPCEPEVHADFKRIADESGKKLYAVVRDARDALRKQNHPSRARRFREPAEAKSV